MKYKKNIGRLLTATTSIICIVSTPIYAADEGVFTTTNITNYINPDTGTTDDGGTQNAAIGEGMCRSIIDEITLIEIENDKIYATIRMHLYENIPSVNFKIQEVKGDSNSYYEVSHEVMQEDFYEDFADLRFEIPKTDTLIQCVAYVTPMGREVCFYIEIESELTPYDGNDYIVSISENLPAEEVITNEEIINEDIEEIVTEEASENTQENEKSHIGFMVLLFTVVSILGFSFSLKSKGNK